MNESQWHFVDRLRSNLQEARDELARIQAIRAQLVDQGHDTSTFDPATSAQSPDQTYRMARGHVEVAHKNFAQYLADHGIRYQVVDHSVGEAGLTARPGVWDHLDQVVVDAHYYRQTDRQLAQAVADELNAAHAAAWPKPVRRGGRHVRG